MNQISLKITFFALIILFSNACKSRDKTKKADSEVIQPEKNTLVLHSSDKEFDRIVLAAEKLSEYLPLIQNNQKIGIVTNQTGIVPSAAGNQHLVDVLLENQVNLVRIFAPEHGFRGEADAGETVKDGKDTKTGLPIISLYGDNKKPKASQIQDLDIILFDIQDVGARFYTYISTLHYVMEAAAESNKKVIVLDRPNPNAHYIDGPILEKSQQTFVGMHPVPIVYGMTIGEYALMINGEKWLNKGIKADLSIIPLENYTHQTPYSLPVKPSPNLPNDLSINLYPSTCFFEGVNVNEGRGTDKQFQVYGSPFLKGMSYEYTPKPNAGSKSPKFNGELCYGEDLSQEKPLNEISLKWLLKAYNANTKQPFFTKNSGAFWLDKLAGTASLREQIEKGWTEEQIKATWKQGIEDFKTTRAKYLLYP